MNRICMRQMIKGQSGQVTKVTAAGELGRRIRDMGLVPGTTIQIQGRAPLRDPVAIKIMDFTLILRNNEADFIFVEIT
jgi:ferrous iron transport protein A